MIYRRRKHYSFSPALDIQAAGERLHKLVSSGQGDVRSILEDARPEDSVLHAGIRSWDIDPDDAKERVLLDEARYLRDGIAVVHVVNKQEHEAPAFMEVRVLNRVVALSDAVKVPEIRDSLIAQGLKDLEPWQSRYAQVSEFIDIHQAINQTRRKAA